MPLPYTPGSARPSAVDLTLGRAGSPSAPDHMVVVHRTGDIGADHRALAEDMVDHRETAEDFVAARKQFAGMVAAVADIAQEHSLFVRLARRYRR